MCKLVSTSRHSYAEYRQLTDDLFLHQRHNDNEDIFKKKIEEKYRSTLKNLRDEGFFVGEKGLLKFESTANLQRFLTDISNLISIGIKDVDSSFSSANDQTMLKAKMRHRSRKPHDIVFYGVSMCEAYKAKSKETIALDTSSPQKVALKRRLTISPPALESVCPKSNDCVNQNSPNEKTTSPPDAHSFNKTTCERSVNNLFEELLEEKIMGEKSETKTLTPTNQEIETHCPSTSNAFFPSGNCVIEYSQQPVNECAGIILPDKELCPSPPAKKKCKVISKNGGSEDANDFEVDFDSDDNNSETIDVEDCEEFDALNDEDEESRNVSNYAHFGFDATIEQTSDAKNAMDELFKHLNPSTLETYKNVNDNFQKLVMIAQAQSEQLLAFTNYYQKHFKKINHLFVYNPKKKRWSLNCSGCPVHCPINISIGQRQKTLKTFNKTNKELQSKCS